MVVATSCKSFEAADASAWNLSVRTSSCITCSANGTMKCNPSPNTLFSTAPTYRTTPLCPACTMTTDSDITTIIIINVTIPASIFSLFDPRIDLDGLAVPLYPYGYPSGVPLKGFFIKLPLYDINWNQ